MSRLLDSLSYVERFLSGEEKINRRSALFRMLGLGVDLVVQPAKLPPHPEYSLPPTPMTEEISLCRDSSVGVASMPDGSPVVTAARNLSGKRFMYVYFPNREALYSHEIEVENEYPFTQPIVIGDNLYVLEQDYYKNSLRLFQVRQDGSIEEITDKTIYPKPWLALGDEAVARSGGDVIAFDPNVIETTTIFTEAELNDPIIQVGAIVDQKIVCVLVGNGDGEKKIKAKQQVDTKWTPLLDITKDSLPLLDTGKYTEMAHEGWKGLFVSQYATGGSLIIIGFLLEDGKWTFVPQAQIPPISGLSPQTHGVVHFHGAGSMSVPTTYANTLTGGYGYAINEVSGGTTQTFEMNSPAARGTNTSIKRPAPAWTLSKKEGRPIGVGAIRDFSYMWSPDKKVWLPRVAKN